MGQPANGVGDWYCRMLFILCMGFTNFMQFSRPSYQAVSEIILICLRFPWGGAVLERFRARALHLLKPARFSLPGSFSLHFPENFANYSLSMTLFWNVLGGIPASA